MFLRLKNHLFNFQAVRKVLKLDISILLDGQFGVWNVLVQVGSQIIKNLKNIYTQCTYMFKNI